MARLKLSEGEVDRFEAGILQMLNYFSRMMEIDVQELSPTSRLFRSNRLREDILSGEDLTDLLLKNAPELEGRFLVIPNVL
ncbi:Glutamyl-tRNA(Gln) amidotransferase subunit C [subsurface metagenome]